MSINWLQLSDFHIGKDLNAQRQICEEIVKHAQKRLEQQNIAVDFLFVTGDLANRGQAGEYEIFYDEFLINLLSAINLDLNRALIIPGNHDVNINIAKSVKRFGVFDEIKSFFDATEEGLQERKYLFDRFDAYINHDEVSLEIDGVHWICSKDGITTRVFENVNGHKVGIIGMNTAWLCEGDKPDRGNLTPGVNLVRKAVKSIEDCDIRIALGHHPFRWLVDDDESTEDSKVIKNLFGRNGIVYLHGHLHKGENKFEYGAGYPFLSIGTEACFAARKDRIWPNGFCWGQLDPTVNEIIIEPMQWKDVENDFVFNSMAYDSKFLPVDKKCFAFPIPKPITETNEPSRISSPPAGWRRIDKRFLVEKKSAYRPSDLADFFDGGLPDWGKAQSDDIPKRWIVRKVLDDLRKAGEQKDGICFRVLLGAGGEGKTTALMQTVVELVKNSKDWNILWQEVVFSKKERDDEDPNWNGEYFENLPEIQGNWLIVTDSADSIVNGLRNTLEVLQNDGRNDVHFLVSCRTSDWMSVNANLLPWDLLTDDYEPIQLNLRPDEAKDILKAWKRHGGWKNLEGLSEDDAIQKFREAAISESGRNDQAKYDEGTLLGAMLTLRYGKKLRGHVLQFMQKLNNIQVSDDRTLLDVYAFIAVLHAHGFKFLSKTVLAKTIGYKIGQLYPKVLSKLADEAAIFTPAFAGPYQELILTRHKSVAETVTEILLKEFRYDITEAVYVPLVQAVDKLYLEEKIKVPNVRDWNLLPKYFFEKKIIDLAVRLIEAKQQIQPENPYFVTQLANLYRNAEMHEESSNVFRDAPEYIERDRAYYQEWGTCEGIAGNRLLSAWLIGISIANFWERRSKNYEIGDLNDYRLRTALNSLSINFKELSNTSSSDSQTFLNAGGASAYLGLKVKELDEETRASLEQNWKYYKSKVGSSVEAMDNMNALKIIENSIRLAWKRTDKSDLPQWLIPADELSFRGLEDYFKNV